MASKRSATQDSKSSDPQEPQTDHTQISQRPPRRKSFPKRFKHGIDKQIPGIPITQATPITTVKMNTSKKASTADTPPRRGKEQIHKSRKTTTSQTSSQAQSSSHHQQHSVPQVSRENPALFEIYNHSSIPKGFSSEDVTLYGEDAIRFQENYEAKSFCPSVYVNLDALKEECNLDLTHWLRQFEPLISIRASYSPSFVKTFYYCMQSDNLLDADRNLVEERITTSIRGKQITITAAYLNSLLQIQNPPPVASPNYTNRQIFTLLRPDEPVPDALETLDFTPVSMPPKQRAAWYIYTRNLVQKGGNFTHFAKKDFPIFASIIDQVPHNIGDWIFKEMFKFRFHGRKTSQIPFASLISVIMFHERVWYLPANEKPEKPAKFGQHILNLMRISFDQGSDHSRAPSRPTRTRATQSRVQEAQSAPPPPQSFPSDLDERIKTYIAQVVSDLSSKIESGFTTVKKGYEEFSDAQEDLILEHEIIKEKVQGLRDQIGDHSVSISTLLVSMSSLHDKMDKILENQSINSAGPSSSAPPPSSEPIPTSIAPEPSTHDPILQSTSISSHPPLFDDAKGGEELK